MRLFLYWFFLTILIGCGNENESPNLVIDHFNIWVDNPAEGKKKLEEIGFTAVPDSLSQIHKGQGTTGRYFYFLNMYLELIFINDQEEFEANVRKNDQLDFMERSNSADNGFSPFSVALKIAPYQPEEIPFKTIPYAQDWMGEGNTIFVAKNSKLKKTEPSLFFVYPIIEYDVFERKADLSKIPEEYALWRQFYYHKNGAEKVTKIKIHTNQLEEESETVRALQQMENVELIEGKEYLMEVYFDYHQQKKFYDLRPELPLKIYL